MKTLAFSPLPSALPCLEMRRPVSYFSDITHNTELSQRTSQTSRISGVPPSRYGHEGLKLIKASKAATRAVEPPRDRSEVSERPEKNQKYSCLLTRAELKAIIAKQLG